MALPKSKARTRSYRINNQVLTEELAHDPTGTTQENVLDDSNPFSPKSMQNVSNSYMKAKQLMGRKLHRSHNAHDSMLRK